MQIYNLETAHILIFSEKMSLKHPFTVITSNTGNISSSKNEANIETIENDSELSTESKHITKRKVISLKDADITLAFMVENDTFVREIRQTEERKLRRKVALIIVSLTATIDFLLYSDKATLSYASIFELWEDTHLTQNRYNNATTLFYVGYIVGLTNLLWVQKFPIRNVMIFMCTSWTIITLLHCVAYNYYGIYALRFFLGFVEAIAVPTLNITMNQFLTPNEKNVYAPIFYSSCMGCGIFRFFDCIWKLFMIIIGGMTFLMTMVVYFIYPSNPTDAKFLSKEEKVWVIRRVQKSSNSSIEQKYSKKYQIIEAFRDPITWLFCAFFLFQQLANNLTYMQNLLFENRSYYKSRYYHSLYRFRWICYFLCDNCYSFLIVQGKF
ncbi:Yct1p NDAI_0D00110 [Naumovozyma dairenensis CBS 421]|uniref:Major facilitator superfamily (MFS) profile domain-containing protein n=1 Tax=Naumovozyma dairenensis (strain ATCC 10597 / BCRC 20456 / CBS 421 / NBRC 0211 / NRRL Y-12639) TaxID=1071378 RepID=G0W964_NAUDC|nr:hypothetical protein NDAI_0D00110 [Naumovozyma dairenensis CBS 421]CCD24325.1 hypothetical protein NDAI_0D00110 [Naumovozyma dairenensis CBS 421]